MRNCEHSGLRLNHKHRMCLYELFCCHFSILKSGYAVPVPVPVFIYVLYSNYLKLGDFCVCVCVWQVEDLWYLNVSVLWWSQWCESSRIKTRWTSGFLDIGHCLFKRWTQHFRDWIYSYVQVKEFGVICFIDSDRRGILNQKSSVDPTARCHRVIALGEGEWCGCPSSRVEGASKISILKCRKADFHHYTYFKLLRRT
jgi:hypothetical protein